MLERAVVDKNVNSLNNGKRQDTLDRNAGQIHGHIKTESKSLKVLFKVQVEDVFGMEVSFKGNVVKA